LCRLEQGYLQSYVDFFYITTDTTPSEIQPSVKLKEEQRLNKRAGKTKFEQTEESLLNLSENLKLAENYQKEGKDKIKECFKTYLEVAEQFQKLNDWETASYFHKRCLDVSVEV
jgi:hypothetical protein